jgi:hypothetical protein
MVSAGQAWRDRREAVRISTCLLTCLFVLGAGCATGASGEDDDGDDDDDKTADARVFADGSPAADGDFGPAADAAPPDGRVFGGRPDAGPPDAGFFCTVNTQCPDTECCLSPDDSLGICVEGTRIGNLCFPF